MPDQPIPKSARNRTGKARGGRPTRSEALRRAVLAAGIDPALVDPKRILAGIAADPDAPASARVTACKALMMANAGLPPAPYIDPEQVPEDDELTRRALAIAAGRGGTH